MSPIVLTLKEMRCRWRSSGLTVVLVAVIAGTVCFFTVNNAGFQKEIGRNARDIGSNVVILPAEVDTLSYHNEGGYSEKTMTDQVVQQLIEYKASLNHLIPMLERKVELVAGERTARARLVGLSASIPVPGRPKAPMQKAIDKEAIQLGSSLAANLGISRTDEQASVEIRGQRFRVERVNRETGTWQDGVALMDLESAQKLLSMPNRISRIEAIECTQEQCEATGLASNEVLAGELARITDQARLLRRDQMAEARSKIRVLSRENLGLLQNVLWVSLAIMMMGLTFFNALQRQPEIGVLHTAGFTTAKISTMLMLRSVLLATVATVIGIPLAAALAWGQSGALFSETGAKFSIDWSAAMLVGLVTLVLACLASWVPAFLAASRHPADLIGRDA